MSELRLADYDYALPPGRIAQHPLPQRDAARLLVLDRNSGARSHRVIRDLPELLRPGDLLVVNATRVLPARLRGRKVSGGIAEALLLGPAHMEAEDAAAAPASAENPPRDFAEAVCCEALLRTRGRLRVGQKLRFEGNGRSAEAEIAALLGDGRVRLAFAAGTTPHALGEMPLPPYIRRPRAEAADAARYQTVFARAPGSIAAPTAGLHLSKTLLAALRAGGIGVAKLVLHVGIGTFRPLRPAQLAKGRLHAERFELSAATAARVNETRSRGGRVVAVGTTTARVLESCAAHGGVAARSGETSLFLRPGSRFRVCDALLTNFHLPRSSLLLLVCAFAGREPVLAAYAEAIRRGYRFYSYGDAMLLQ